MRLPLLLVAALFVTAGFVGCLGGSGNEPKPALNSTAASAPLNVSVDTGSSTNATGDMGHMAHMHDYWNGKERVTILDQDVSISPQQALPATFTNALRDHSAAVGGTTVKLPDGNTVYEGTGKIEITATWTDPTVTGATLRYRSAATADWSDAKTLSTGTPLSLDVTPDMCDMPHEKTSRWAFQLVPAQGQVMEGTIHVRVDIVRMHDITLWPGHAMLFEGAHTLVLFDGPATSSHQSAESAIVDRATSNGDETPPGVEAQKVVPMETAWMSANVSITDATASLGQVRNISFLYKAADTNNFRRANVTFADLSKGSFVFNWPVNMLQTDSPYAKTSQWRFDLQIQTSDPTGTTQSFLSDAQVQYKLQVVAYDAANPTVPPPAAS